MYEIRFGILKASDISDRVLVINPNYGNNIGKYGSRSVKPDGKHYRDLEAKEGFYSKLEASLLKEGFRNPIFCNSIKEGTFCRYGTSRLWIAKKQGLDVPCIIADHDGRWSHLELLEKEEDIAEKFKEIPAVIEIGREEMRIDGCAHSHL